MTLVATYNQAEARVELVTTGLLTAGAIVFSIQRAPSPSGPWTNVRGVVDKQATTNSAQTWYDYEYSPGPDVTNYYQVISKTGPLVVGFGTPSSAGPANPVNLSAGWHASTAVGDVLVAEFVGTGVNASSWPPAISGSGWTLISSVVDNGGVNPSTAVWMKQVQSGDSGPTTVSHSYTGNGYAQLQVITLRNVNPVVTGLNQISFDNQATSTTQIRYGLLFTPPDDHSLILVAGASSGTTGWTSVAASAGFTIIDDNGASRASTVWQYQVQTTAAAVPAGIMTITGGSHGQNMKIAFSMSIQYNPDSSAVTTLFTDDVDTPLTEVWLKDPLRPPRNIAIQVASPTQIRLAARSGLFDIKGRAEPIEISEIRRASSWTQRWVFTTFAELDALLELFASGRTLLLHVPARGDIPDCPPWPRNLPGGYIYVGDVAQETAPDEPIPGTMTAPVQIVAAPDPGQGYLESPVP